MTCWVIREGRLVEKGSIAEAIEDRRSIFPTPMISRMEPFESPVTGKEISSWRERDRDMDAANAVDPRDIPQKLFDKRREMVKRNERSEPAA